MEKVTIGLIPRKLMASDFKRLPRHGKPLGLGLADVTPRELDAFHHIGPRSAEHLLAGPLAIIVKP